MARDSVSHTLLVATVLCVVCSVLVASAAVGLRGRQEANEQLDQKKNVLIAAGLFDDEENTVAEIDEIFESSVERILIDLASGQQPDPAVVSIETYQQREAARDPELSVPIEPSTKLGGIKRREKYSFVYRIQDESGQIVKVVLPVYGKGLWSTLYGFLALNATATTVEGITFYEHGETPGLGGEIENPDWRALWQGKALLDDDGQVALAVVKGSVSAESANAENQVDGLSGATITCNGVTQLVQYWMGPDGFGPYLEKLRQQAGPGGSDG